MGSGRYSAVVRSRFAASASEDMAQDMVAFGPAVAGQAAWGISYANHVPPVEGGVQHVPRQIAASAFYQGARLVLVVAVVCYVAGLLFVTGSMFVMGVGAVGIEYTPSAEMLRARLRSTRAWSTGAGSHARYNFSSSDDYHPSARVVSISRALLRATCRCPGILPPHWDGMLAVVADTDGVLWLDKMTEREAREARAPTAARTATAAEMTALGTNGTMLLDVHARRKPPVRADLYCARRTNEVERGDRRSGTKASGAEDARRVRDTKGGRNHPASSTHRCAQYNEDRSSVCACALDGDSAVLAPLHWPGLGGGSWGTERDRAAHVKQVVRYLEEAWALCRN